MVISRDCRKVKIMKKYYPCIQMFSGVLFLFILAFHCGVPFASFGWGGVEAFFVISSFFLVRRYYGANELDIIKQFKHRLLRLYPPYIAVLVVAVMYALLRRAIPYDIITHLFSAQNFQWMLTGYQSAMQFMTAHTWTLSIEVWSGLVWLVLLKFIPKKRIEITMSVMLLIGVAYRVTTIECGADVYVVSLCPLAHFDAFACGSLLAIGYRNGKIDKRIGLIGIVGIVGIIACIVVMAISNNTDFAHAYQMLSTSKNYLNYWFTGNIYIFISLSTIGIFGLLLRWDEKRITELGRLEKTFVSLGNNSYVLYLFHWPLLIVIKRFVHSWILSFPLVLIATFIATLFFTKVYSEVKRHFFGGNKA